MPNSIPCSLAWRGEGDRVGERVVADLGHDRHAARGPAVHDLVDPHALGERQRPELAHHAAAEDPVDPQRVDVVLDRRLQPLLVDVPAVRGERRRDRDPQAVHGVAREALGRREHPRSKPPERELRETDTSTTGSAPRFSSARSGSPVSHSMSPATNRIRPPARHSMSSSPRLTTTSASSHSSAWYARRAPGERTTSRRANAAGSGRSSTFMSLRRRPRPELIAEGTDSPTS